MLHLIKRIIKESLDEALRDELPDYMINAVKKNNPNVADKFLDMDVPQHTELIPSVKIELDESNIRNKFIKEIQNHFKKSILEQFKKTKLYENFMKKNVIANVLRQGLSNYMNVRDSHFFLEIFYNTRVFNDMANQDKRFMNKLKFFYSKDFPLLQGKGNSLINPIFSKNKSNVFSFIKSFNTAFPQHTIDLNAIMNDRVLQGLREPIMNFDENVNDLSKSKLYLYITDKPADVLRMSVSNFYSSCQNLYSGTFNEKLLANVFDENSKIAYLIFDSPYIDNQGNKHPFTPIARTIIRVGKNKEIMFDETYPSQMEEDFYNILEKYTDLENEGNEDSLYSYKDIGLPKPYMDRYNIVSDIPLDKNPKAIALANLLKINVNNLSEKSDDTFYYKNKNYVVYTKDEANEFALDEFRNGWMFNIYNTNFYDLIEKYKILDLKSVLDVLDYNPEFFTDKISPKEFLKQNGIIKYEDFEYELQQKMENYWTWFKDGETFNMTNLIKYFGGMDGIRKKYIAGKEIINNGYYIYVLD